MNEFRNESAEKPKQSLISIIGDLKFYSGINWLPVYIPKNINMNGTVVDIGCGSALHAVGMLKQMSDQGFIGNYFGSDISQWQDLYYGDIKKQMEATLELPISDIDSPRLKEYWQNNQKPWQQFWEQNKDKINLDFGEKYDATSKNFWTEILNKTQNISLLMIRQPDFDSSTEIFTKIFDNMISFAQENNLPIIITSSRLHSANNAIKAVEEIFKQKSITQILKESVWADYKNEVCTIGYDIDFQNGQQLKTNYLGDTPDYVKHHFNIPGRSEDSFILTLSPPKST